MTHDFRECDACRVKPGSPILCSGCLHNRDAIHELNHQMTRRKDNDHYVSIGYFAMMLFACLMVLLTMLAALVQVVQLLERVPRWP
jgi:hypothetical protein